MAPKEKYPFPIWPVIGLLLTVVLPIVLFPVGLIIEQREDQKEARLESARDKAMELCLAWSKTQPTYISKPGLYQYSQTDYGDKLISATSIWIPDPDEIPKEESSAGCVVDNSEKELGIALGVLIPMKYRSEAWPCHRGKRLNPLYDPDQFLSKEYIDCLPYEYQYHRYLGFMKPSEPAKVWKVDLEGNQLADK